MAHNSKVYIDLVLTRVVGNIFIRGWGLREFVTKTLQCRHLRHAQKIDDGQRVAISAFITSIIPKKYILSF